MPIPIVNVTATELENGLYSVQFDYLGCDSVVYTETKEIAEQCELAFAGLGDYPKLQSACQPVHQVKQSYELCGNEYALEQLGYRY